MLYEVITMFVPDLSYGEWIQFALCGLLLGMSKTGLSGAGLMVVPIMAQIFGGRTSVGIVLPMLLVADVFAVSYYHRHANWAHILRLAPAALVGIVIGVFFGKFINDAQFKTVITSYSIHYTKLYEIRLDLDGHQRNTAHAPIYHGERLLLPERSRGA